MSPKLNLVAMTMEEHSRYIANAHPGWGHWYPSNPEQAYQTVYLDPWCRFHIQHERHSEPGFGLERQELAGEQGVDISERDTVEFARRFLEVIGDRMSIHQLNIFIKELTEAAHQWERERQAALARVDHTK